MSILLSGDFHANAANEITHITKHSLLKKYQQEKYGDIKFHIILGDGGFLWPGNRKTDLYNYKILAKRPFPVLCVLGNHEPIYGSINVPEVDAGIGETVYCIQDNPFIAYLKRGKVYTIDGIKFLVLGGGLSIDKDVRKPNVSWWAEEYWSEQEKKDIFKLLETENTFDCILSHTGPHHINKLLFGGFTSVYSDKSNDEVALLNDKIDSKIDCSEWWCGHWHKDTYYYDEQKNRGYQYLYDTTILLTRQNNEIIVRNEYRGERMIGIK